jgi:DNA-binding transcriptional MerR regulator
MTTTLTDRFAHTIYIGALAELAGVTVRTLRYYEVRGFIQPMRDRSNVRRYDWVNRQRAVLLARIRRCGLPLRDAARIVALHEAGEAFSEFAESGIEARLEALERQRADLIDLRETLNALEASSQAPVLHARAS